MGRLLRKAPVLPLLLMLGAADDPPQRIQLSDLRFDLAEDGSFTETINLRMAVATDGAARQAAQFPLDFTPSVETLDLVQAYTQKPDGRTIPVPPGSVQTRLAPGLPTVPMYSDRQQKVVLFPDPQAGDVLVSSWRRHMSRPVLPGQFTLFLTYVRTMPWDQVDVYVITPADKPLQTESVGPTLTESTTLEGRHRYHFHYDAPHALASDPGVLAAIDREPRLFASSLDGWPAFSRAYHAVFAPKAAVTPRVQALADEITTGTEDKRQQAELLYAWVNNHIRWVAIYLGTGNWVPHSADEVIANGLGDCKDQVALFVALLTAKGIAAEAVLINLGPSYTLSGPATTAGFNHVITSIPSLGLVADTTVRAPFGTLVFPLYGKPILPVTAEGASPGRIAVVAPGQAEQSLETVMALRSDGTITGSTETTATGPWIIPLRLAATQVEATGADATASAQLKRLGLAGTGHFDLKPGQDRLGGTFTLEAHPDYLTGEAFRIPAGLRVLSRVADLLIGPAERGDLPASAPTPCYAGQSEETLSLALPPGLHPERLPRDAAVTGPAFRYESQWRFANGTISVHRMLVSTVDQPLCEGALREAAVDARGRIARDLNARVTLAGRSADDAPGQ